MDEGCGKSVTEKWRLGMERKKKVKERRGMTDMGEKKVGRLSLSAAAAFVHMSL